MNPPAAMEQRQSRVGVRSWIQPWPLVSLPTRRWILAILLVGAAIRLYGLNNLSPPGLEHDEVANWLIDRAILDGNHAIYFTAAYGHEAGFHYLQTIFVALLGDHALALRLPAAFAGLLLVAVSFSLARRLFGSGAALVSAALLATSFVPVFYSRLGLRAISLPLTSGLAAYFWWLAWQASAGPALFAGDNGRFWTTGSSLRFGLAGIFAGLSLHTYMAARAVPIFFALYLVYLALFHRKELNRRRRGILLFLLTFLAVAAPLLIFLGSYPGAEFRISEIDGPLRALFSGDLRPVLNNILKIIGAFGFAGDPLWRQNVSGLPLFDPLVATLFYLSLPLVLICFSDVRYGFLLLWLMTSLTPSMVTIDAPSSIRIVNSLPVLTIFPALLIHNSGHLSTVINGLSTKNGYLFRQLGLGSLILYSIVLTSHSIYRVWPQNEEVQFVWQKGLTAAARYLDDSTDSGPVAIGGWSPGTMDPPTMELSLQRDDLRLSYFDPRFTLLLPAASNGAIRLLHPTILQLDASFAGKLAAWGATVQQDEDFTLYTLPALPTVQPQFTGGAHFEGQIRFLGLDRRDGGAGRLELVTYWQVDDPGGPRRLFVHLLDGDEALLAEDYAFDESGARKNGRWQPGDLILRRHLLDVGPAPEPAAGYAIRVGFYDPDSCPPLPCRNLQTGQGEPFLELSISSK
jgi:4-amino-4-deoxy-L-arabinose transferase-like glycosyltransferase